MAKTPKLEFKKTAGSVDVEIVPVFQDVKKKLTTPAGPYRSVLTKLAKKTSYSGSYKTTRFVQFGGERRAASVLFVGLGPRNAVNNEMMRQAGAGLWTKLANEKAKSVSLTVDGLSDKNQTGKNAVDRAFAFAEGLSMAAYKYEQPSKKSSAKSLETVTIFGEKVSAANARKLNERAKTLYAVVEAINVTRRWSNLPSNIGTPDYYAKDAAALARKAKLKCTVLKEKEIRREKMGLFLGVSQGSQRPPRMVMVEYRPKGGRKAKTVCLVGKGVTFDSGGISLKPGLKMEDMKHDMTGAATVMGAVLAAAKQKAKNRVIAIMVFCENMPSGNAIMPGNVLTSRAGKTVEIINTDAEGRLILADALDYAHKFKPDCIIDTATLTGAVGIALGRINTAMLTNDGKLLSTLFESAKVTGERFWQMPLQDDYFDDLKSDYADMKNTSNSRLAGTIQGGIFLKQFIKGKLPWAHLDIAYTGWDNGHLPYCPKRGASGLVVRTLAQFADDY